MYKSKLIDVFSALTAKEQRALKKFVQSPYHNRREDVVALYHYIYKYRSLENREALRKENIFAQLFPGEQYDVDKIDYLMSFLLKITEQFIMVERLLHHPVDAQINLTEGYRRKRLRKHFEQSWRHAANLQEKQALRDSDYFRRSYHLEYERYAFSVMEKRAEAKNLQQLSDSFDIYFLAERLKQACLMLAHKAVYKTDYDWSMVELLIPYIESKPELLEAAPSLGIYYYYYKTSAAKDLQATEADFREFKRRFFQYINALPEEESWNLYIFAINYCIRRSNTGSEEYILELLDFYKLGLEKKILLKDDLLSPSTFKNIVKAALKTEKYEWTCQFIEKYEKYLPLKQRKPYTHYAWGEYYYRIADYQKAMLHLQQIEHSDIFMNLSARVILIKIYYTLGEFDVLDALLNSMKTYLSRKEKLGYHRENYKNILSYARKLIQLNIYNKKAVEKLYKEVEAEPQLTEKNWFLAQLKVLL